MRDATFHPDWFSKPGDTLAVLINERALSVDKLADDLKCTIATLRGVLAGTVAVDYEFASRLCAVVGGSVAFWRKRQETYQTALARVAETIPTDVANEWLRKLPKADMVANGWVGQSNTRLEAVKSCLAYFGVTGPDEWQLRYTSICESYFRTSKSFESKIGALSVWLRQGEIEAELIACRKWNPDGLRSLLPSLRSLTKSKSLAFVLPRLRRLCAEVGVVVTFVRSPSGCRASGAARFISPDKALVILSFRHLSNDHFWFTFFHEIGHLILHGPGKTFVDSAITSNDQSESEANAFAAGVLVPQNRQAEMRAIRTEREEIIRFAVSIGIAPGIVVGQLQHLGLVGRDQFNYLKRRYNWSQISAALS